MKPIDSNSLSQMRQKNFPTQNFTTILKRVFSWLLVLGLVFVVYKMITVLRRPPSVEVAEIKQENVARAKRVAIFIFAGVQIIDHSAPFAYFAMSEWLQNFAYHIRLGAGPFLLGGGLALFIALATVSAHAIKAALTNPIEALRYE